MLGEFRNVRAVRTCTVGGDLAGRGGVGDQATTRVKLRLRQTLAGGAEAPRGEVVAAGIHDHEVDAVLGAALHLRFGV